MVGDRAVRRNARHHDAGQGHLGGLCRAVGGGHLRADRGPHRPRLRELPPRPDVLVPPRGLRRGARRGSADQTAQAGRAVRPAGRRAAAATRRAQAAAPRGRRARARAARGDRVRRRQGLAVPLPARREVRRDVHRGRTGRGARRLAERRSRRRRERRSRDGSAAVHRHGAGDRRDRATAHGGVGGDREQGRQSSSGAPVTATASPQSKVTYTSANVDWELFHRQFDEALARVRAQLGRDHPLYIGGDADGQESGALLVDTSPIDTSVVLGRFAAATAPQVDRAVAAARAAQPAWLHRGWRDRVTTLRKAAGLIRDRKFELAAIMSLEVGKSRLEAMGDAEESADLIDYYCQQVEDADGFVRPMGRITPVERNTDVLRPYGVFACIAPFNFPLALSTGMSSAALVAGNAVVYKPAEEASWTGLKLYEIYRDAGLPPGVFNYLSGYGPEAGETLWRHPGVDGVVFTGSKAVGLRIHQGLATRWIKPCLLEMGGKNAAIVMESADLDAAAEGVVRSAFGLQNQKCSATSRVYVHENVAQSFIALGRVADAQRLWSRDQRGVGREISACR